MFPIINIIMDIPFNNLILFLVYQYHLGTDGSQMCILRLNFSAKLSQGQTEREVLYRPTHVASRHLKLPAQLPSVPLKPTLSAISVHDNSTHPVAWAEPLELFFIPPLSLRPTSSPSAVLVSPISG